MNQGFVIARSTSDAAIHEHHSASPWIATAFGLAMTMELFMERIVSDAAIHEQH